MVYLSQVLSFNVVTFASMITMRMPVVIPTRLEWLFLLGLIGIFGFFGQVAKDSGNSEENDSYYL